MNTSVRNLILSASITGLALAASPTLAQGPGGRGEGQTPSQEERAEARAEMLTALDLSANQSVRVEAILDTLNQASKSRMDIARKSGDREAMKQVRDEIKELQNAADTQLKSIMSEDQYTKYTELRESLRGGKGGRRGDRGNRQ